MSWQLFIISEQCSFYEINILLASAQNLRQYLGLQDVCVYIYVY